MTLGEALRALPSDTVLRNHINNRLLTASEILATLSIEHVDESGYELNKSLRNRGSEEYHTIYATGIGILFSEA